MGGGFVADEVETVQDSHHPERTLVLVGRTGNGKSATGNSILGRHMFDSRLSGTYITNECELQKATLPNGLKLNVIDTPGLFSACSSTEFTSREIVKCLLLAKDGIDAVILTFSLRSRLTEEEQSTLRTLKILFGSRIVDYIIVVFTNADALVAGKTLEDYLKGCPQFKDIIEECGNRKMLFDNSPHVSEIKKEEQVQDLLNYVEQISKINNGNSYMADLSLELWVNVAAMEEKQKRFEALKSRASSEQEISQMKKEVEKLYNEMQEGIKEKISNQLEESLRDVKEQLAKAEEAREEAKNKMNEIQKLSSDEINMLREQLNKAESETASLRTELNNKCTVL